MKWAIDIDGTLTAHPEQFVGVLKLLIPGPHSVVLLTGELVISKIQCGLTPNPHARVRQVVDLLKDHRGNDLLKNDGKPWFDIVSCAGLNVSEVAMLKARYCKDNQIDVFVDDTEMHCSIVRGGSPDTLVLQVTK